MRFVSRVACEFECDTSKDNGSFATLPLSSTVPHHMTSTFNKHLSLAIFDKHLVRQTNQGWPKILPQYPLETALTVT